MYYLCCGLHTESMRSPAALQISLLALHTLLRDTTAFDRNRSVSVASEGPIMSSEEPTTASVMQSCYPGWTPREPAYFVANTPRPSVGGARNKPAPLISPREAGRYGRLRVEAPKTIDQLRKLITGGIRCPVFAGSKTGELSISNSAVMSQDKITRTFNTHELVELRLPLDEQDTRRFHIKPDAHTFRRRKLLIRLIGDNLLIHTS